ncbi:alpha/beta fold hydrolase [Candidatus Synechococcus spongiarum]|uniref:Possible alpha/beta hydrolase superfamily,slr1827 homolog n=1 Tax=Candidatus Synechococcus spongiarum TaxID=431041 RepID=A0A170T6R5_9SYNE|nr:alpha/beta fold hydrolase [Candidatus Synechococcus spongiarum]CZB15381.1 Possible alpha/beta hydrolase superfamily,slr1827 homolog [Candidatus Synechococcus spongiarum]
MAAAGETTDWGQVSVLHWQGQPLQVRQLGGDQGPPLVLIHGFAAAAGHWRANAPAFAAAGWRVYGVDLLGFGASAQPFLVQDNRTWAQQVLHLVEQRIQEPVVIVGHSLGALVGLTAAVARPELVKALVLAPLQDPALLKPRLHPRRSCCRCGRQLLTSLQRWLVPWRLILWLFSRPWLLALGLRAAYHHRHRVDQPLLRLFARPCCRSGAARSLAGMTMGMGGRPPQATAPALLRRVAGPVLVLWGQEDRLAPEAMAKAVVRLRPDVPCRVLEGCGHCPHDEDPKRFNGVVLAWLRETFPA